LNENEEEETVVEAVGRQDGAMNKATRMMADEERASTGTVAALIGPTFEEWPNGGGGGLKINRRGELRRRKRWLC
jgi:hypothetical protein